MSEHQDIVIAGDGEKGVVTLSGDMGVEKAEPLKAALVEALATYKELAVDVAGVADLDVSCLQLLMALAAAAEEKQVNLTPIQGAPELVLQRAGYCGVQNFSPDTPAGRFFQPWREA